jgi:signal transduction histidine kinase
LVAVDITKTAKDLKKMQILAGVSIIFVLVVVVVSFLISTFVVTRTSRIATTAKHIMNTGDLSKRIAIDSRWDDLSYMTSVLNEFLDRNQEMVQDIQTVSDNIAHDLRTPLTRLQADLEILAKDPNLKNSKELEQVMAESDRLLATFNALLRISRIETRRQKSAFERIDLNVIVNDVVGFYDPLVQDAGIAIKMQTAPCAMIGDRDLVFQLFANILDNAIKFTPQGGDIQIAMDQQDNHVVVTIHDSGQGVMEENLGKIFQRFFRTDKSRHTKGNGLGLALVKAVVTLHDGDVWAENDNGLKISIRLPYQPT